MEGLPRVSVGMELHSPPCFCGGVKFSDVVIGHGGTPTCFCGDEIGQGLMSFCGDGVQSVAVPHSATLGGTDHCRSFTTSPCCIRSRTDQSH
jgi:hypothetical protein